MTHAQTEPTPVHAGFERPYIDLEQDRKHPHPHHYVHGGFEGTETRFSFYFPTADDYRGRFFQHITPIPESENLAPAAAGREDKIGPAFAAGAYFVETNGGGPDFPTPGSHVDPTIAAYRANAAAADYSRVVAARLYGDHRPFGYAYGGSGGGFRTIGGAENTIGVWDGYVPYVIGSPVAMPNVFTVRMHAMRILREKFPLIVDAYDAGGSEDPFLHLDEEERGALTEATRMGFPPRSWFGWKTMGAHAFSVLYGSLRMIDPDFFTTFWTTEGYLGADPTSSVHRDRLQWQTTIFEVIHGADEATAHGPRGGVDQAFRGGDETLGQVIGVRLATPAPKDTQLADMVVTSGAAKGTRLVLRDVVGDVATFDIPGSGAALEEVLVGDAVTIDNSDVLAAQTYHRHQVPSPDYAGWEQFRGIDGSPTYPQRPFLVGPILAQGASGTIQTGKFNGKMIVVSCLNDREAFAWQADWYAQKVREHLGGDFDDRFRLWYIENGLHGDNGGREEHPTRSIPYIGALHEALRQLSAWVERGELPAQSTAYEVIDGQVVVPADAAQRRGIQVWADLKAEGKSRVDVRPGEEVTLELTAAMPPGSGKIDLVEWDLDGDGEYDAADKVTPVSKIKLHRTVSFAKPGIYFVTARPSAQGNGDPDSIWARLENLARIRIVVT